MSQHILVAGGAGFIGSQTCKMLAQAGYTPVTIDNLSTGYAKSVKWGPLIEADVRDRQTIGELVKKYDIKAAIHFAAFSLVAESACVPEKYFDNNVSAALSFALSLVENGVKALVFSSTAATYGVPQSDLIKETHPLLPINAYGASKLAFEQALYWLDQAHGLPHVVLRYFNAAGADPQGEIGESHDPEAHLIPLVCKAALGKGAALTVNGTDYDTPDGTAIRDYIHVVDLAQAHIKAIEYLLNGGKSDVFNVGTGKGASVKQIIEVTQEVLSLEVPHHYGPRRLGDPKALVADVSKIKAILGWQAKVSDLPNLIKTAHLWQEKRDY